MGAPRFVGRLRVASTTVVELVRGIWRGRYWWLVPLVLFLLPLAALLVLLQAYPVVAPFVYTLF